MVSKTEQIQILYEFAMAIGTSLDLNRMLRKSLTTILRKMNCPAGGVHFFEKDHDGIYHLEKIITIPRDTSHIREYQKALEHIPATLSSEQLTDFNTMLPLSGKAEDGTFNIVELPGLGVVVLLKSGALDAFLVKSLGPVFAKLAVACRACLQNEALLDHQNNLQELVAEKTSELVSKNQQLLREIEHREKSEKALRRSEEEYRELVQNANSIILRWDTEGRVTFFNEYAQAFFGFSEDEIIGRHVVGTIVPERESTGRDLAPLMDDICRHPQKYEYNVNENMRKDGSRVWIAWTNKILTDERGELIGALSIGMDITEHRKSEQRFKLAAEAMSDLIYEWDIRDDALHWFGDIDTALGFEKGEFPHTLEAWLGRIHPEDIARLIDAVGHHRTSTDPISYEYKVQRKDGSWVYWSDYGVPVLDGKGKPCRWIGACTDITERKKAEQELIESEARYRALFTNEIDAICIFEIETNRIVEANDAWLKLHGYQRDDLDRLTINDVTAEPESTKKAVQHSAKMGTGFIPKRRHRKKDGTEFIVELSTGPFTWKNQKLMYALARDITERERDEKSLRRSEERYKTLYKKAKETEERYHSLLNSTLDAIVIYDTDGHVTYVNNAFTLMFGWVLEELSDGVPYVPDSEREVTMQNVFSVIRDGLPLKDFETKRLKKDGGLVDVSISASRFNDHEGNPAGMLVILRDITGHKHSQNLLRQAKEAAETANMAKSAFLANMSHELRTPLNAIIGFSELMTRDPSISRGQSKDLETIVRSGEHLLSLINHVLEFSKIEAGRIDLCHEDFDLHRLLRSLEEMFHLRVRQKGLYLHFEQEDDVPQYIRADQSKLRQILINLLGNAAKFTQKGKINLRVANKTTGNERQTGGCLLRFEVIDTGIGISREEQDKIFDAFFQTNDQRLSQQGTGLGLPISQKFVKMMGGVLAVNSAVGKGTRFTFDIPVELANDAHTESSRLARRVIGLAVRQPVFRLLVAEDNDVNRNLLVRLLKSVGFQVQEAVNGRDAIGIWKEWQPHLIWMDMRMPVMDGYQATTQIKRSPKGKDTVIVALTASAFEEDRFRVIEHGCDDFVRKPFREAEIFEMIEKHLGVRYVYDERDESLKSAVASETMSDGSLSTSINDLPEELIVRLKEATELSDTAMIDEVIADIRTENIQLAEALSRLAENFAYDKILALV